MPWLLEEIEKGPCAVSSVIRAIKTDSQDVAKKILRAGQVTFIGSGSSYNAALPAVWLLTHLGFSARAVQASDVKDFGFPQGGLPVLVSVSGKGDDILAAAGSVFGAVAVSNTSDAPVLRMVEKHMLLGLAPQRAEAATHTFLGTMTAQMWLALDVVEAAGDAKTRAQVHVVKEAMERKIPDLMARVFEDGLGLRDPIEELMRPDHMNLYLVGFGPSYASALDGALKIKEVAQVFSEAHEGENVLHGPAYPLSLHRSPTIVLGSYVRETASKRVARIISELGSPVFYLNLAGKGEDERSRPGAETFFNWTLPYGEALGDILRGLKESSEIGGGTVGILEGEDYESQAQMFTEALLPLLNTIPLQIMAYFLGMKRGYDVDIPPTKKEQIEAVRRNTEILD